MEQGSSSSLTNNRKRDRPCRDDENLIGKVVSGVVEGSFEAGYFLNVNVANTEKQLKGLVFLPERVTPVTPASDLFPQVKMYARTSIPIPSQSQGNQTSDIASDHPMRDAGVGTEAIDERNDPMDTEPEAQTLSLMPPPKEDLEACEASKTAVAATTTSPKDPISEGATTLLDFFPALETSRKQSETEGKKSLEDAEHRGYDLMVEEKTASPIDDVPEELQLELGNKKMSTSAIATEANADQCATSKNGFLVNMCEGTEETVKKPEESSAASVSEVAQVENKDS